MNLVDIIIVLLLLLSAIVGFKRGILKELAMLLGIIIIYFISFSMKDYIGLILCKILPFFSFKGLISLNIIMYQLIAFVIIASFLFTIYNIILKLTGILQKLVDLSIILTLPSKLLGLVAGFIEGYIIMFMILLVLQIPMGTSNMINNSKISSYIVNNTFLLSSSLGKLDDCILDITNLTNESKKIDTNQANLEIIKLELKYNIISQDDLTKLIKTKKLDAIKGINSLK